MIERELAPWRFNSTLLTVFAMTASLIAALGVFATLSYHVAQRRREIGVRMALGASARDVLTWVLSSGLRIVLCGVGIGLATSALTAGYLRAHLYEVAPFAPSIYISVSFLVVAVAVVASSVPARRAAQTNPSESLRAE